MLWRCHPVAQAVTGAAALRERSYATRAQKHANRGRERVGEKTTLVKRPLGP